MSITSARVYATEDYRPESRRIVSVDGEGKTVSGRHAYVLLACADDRGYRDYVEHDGSRREITLHEGPRYDSTSAYHADDTAPNYGLPTVQCLEFLLSIPRAKSDLVISFAFTYDSTKILQDLPYAALREYAELGVTNWNGYTISGIPRKYLEIRRGERHVKVWDVFAYWQMSFVKALDASPELFAEEQKRLIGIIRSMKAERAHFDVISDDEIRDYCFSECEFLSMLYRDVLRHCEHMGLKTAGNTAHGGPGALAASFYQKINLKQFMPTGDPRYYLAGLPVDVAVHSYYGGRFETALLGPAGDLIEFDIQSAYPSIAVNLPCLRCGRFRKVSEYEPGKLGFYFVGSRTSGPWAPFPFRSDANSGRYWMNGASKGSIAFVHGGRRWVTSYEVEVARKHFGADAIPVFSGWVFDTGCTHKPFGEVHRIYLQRKIGDPSCRDCLAAPKHFCSRHHAPSPGLSKIIKLIINSVYGKLAQSIGRDRPYQSYIWASWITGGTRAKVLDAALELGEDCVSIATDGILVRRDLPERFRVTDWELGTWERSPKPDAWLGMPGIYAFRDYGKPEKCELCRERGLACDAHRDDKKFKRRGLDARYFPAEHLRQAWERGKWEVKPSGDPECDACESRGSACANHPPRAFMPLKLAVTRKNALDVLGEWIPTPKTVKFRSVHHKRNFPDDVDEFMPHDGSPIRLEPITIPDDLRSAPYSPKQSWDDVLTPGEVFRLWDGTRAGRGDDPDIPMWADWEDPPELLETMGVDT
jgi:hypothetical protein